MNQRLLLGLLCAAAALPAGALAADRVKIADGVVETAAPPDRGVRSFKGIPFAAPPVGPLRWREPQPVKPWKGVRLADKFGPRCMQHNTPTDDYWFRGDGMSEDCLYLNVWTPAKSDKEHLPVLVYIFGGGFQNGGGSEPRYDGASMARKGIVAVALNYRLNVFGFFAHPELTKESPHHASGNYGLLDQVAALRWVHKNIAAFGGDPRRVTIAGESAGSISVSALMGSPLSRGLIAGAIGESGALLSRNPKPLERAEQDGEAFGAAAGASSLAGLRAMTAEQIQAVQAKNSRLHFTTDEDGYFLPKPLIDIYNAGEQAHVPLLVGSNSEEAGPQAILEKNEPTPQNFVAAVRRLYGERADELLKVYAPATREEVIQAATELASARFIAYGTWKWATLQARTGGKPVFRYLYAHPRPVFLPAVPRGAVASPGAVHSAEIQYAMGNLPLDPRYTWTADDYKVSEVMQDYFANFIETGNPNGHGLPEWPAYSADSNFQIMRLDVDSHAEPEPHLDRYRALDSVETGNSASRSTHF